MTESKMMQAPSSALEWVKRLIQIDTISRNSNLGLIETARDHLRGLGLECWLTFDSRGGKANLGCSIPDANGRVDGGIVLSGHTDVVPVEGQDWDSDPFVPTLRDGRLYGRGTADMKSFIGIALAQVPHLLQRRLSAPVHLALSFDEEVGCLGVPLLLQGFAARGIRPTGCIVGEPTNMQVVVSHKGFSAYRCRFTGQAAHTSLPATGVNAAEYAAQLISFIRGLADEMRCDGPFDAAFDVPYSTAQTVSVTGGGILNTVPDCCGVEFTIRHLPQVDPERFFERVQQYASEVLLPEMRRSASDCEVAVVLERIVSVPGFEAQEATQFMRLIRELSGDTMIRKVAYATEAGLFQQAGVATVVCGPGDILQAHRRNEYIYLEQIEQCEKFLGRLTQHLTLG